MAPGLTDEDMGRIVEYLQTPAYNRTPDQLLPTVEHDADGPER